jgi:hypothetical protein
LRNGGVRHPAEVKVRLEPVGGVPVDERELEEPELDRPRLGHRLFGLPGRRLVVLRFRLPKAALLFLELSTHGIGIDAEPVADLLRVGVDQHLVGSFLYGIAHFLYDVDPAAVRVGIVHAAEVAEKEVEESGRVGDQLVEGIGAVLANEAVRVVRPRDDGDADGQAAGKQVVEGTQRGLLPGGVGVEAEDDLLGVSLENAGLVDSEGSSLRRDGVLDAGQVAGDGIQLAFADDGGLGVENRPLGLVQPVDHAAFAEDGRLGRVDVFAALLLGAEHPAAEADDAALLVADRENKPAAEPVVLALVAGDGEAALFEQGGVVFLRLGPVDRVVPLVRRESDAKAPDRLVADAALG